MKPATGCLITVLLSLAPPAEALEPCFARVDSVAKPTRLHLVTHTGSLRIFPPYPSPIDPFSTPWPHRGDRFGLAGAFDVWQSAHWRFGVQVEGVYTRYDLPLGAPRLDRWRRRILVYGTHVRDGWHITLGVVIHDTGPQERLANVLAARGRGAWAHAATDLACRQTGKIRSAGVRRLTRDMIRVRPQNGVPDTGYGQTRWRRSLSRRMIKSAQMGSK